jgi:hypothetical protein
MNIRAFRTWCKEVGVNPFYAHNIDYVQNVMRFGGYEYSEFLKISYLDKKTAKEHVYDFCSKHSTYDVIYHRITANKYKGYYELYIFSKKELR